MVTKYSYRAKVESAVKHWQDVIGELELRLGEAQDQHRKYVRHLAEINVIDRSEFVGRGGRQFVMPELLAHAVTQQDLEPPPGSVTIRRRKKADRSGEKQRRDYQAEHARRRELEAARAQGREPPPPTKHTGSTGPRSGPHAKGTGKKSRYMDAIRSVMADGLPRMGNEIIAAIGVTDKVDKQSVYNALSYLKLQTKELHQSQIGEPYTLNRAGRS